MIGAADNERLAAEREHYRELYLRTLEQCRKLELGLLGQKAERLSPNDAQLTMQVLATLLDPRGAVEPSLIATSSASANTRAQSRPDESRSPNICPASTSRSSPTTSSARGETSSTAPAKTLARPSSAVRRRW
jgi:hypothetical protein